MNNKCPIGASQPALSHFTFTVTKCLTALLDKDLQTPFSPQMNHTIVFYQQSGGRDIHWLSVTKYGL